MAEAKGFPENGPAACGSGDLQNNKVSQAAIADQLEKILSSAVFRNSSRCTKFLRYVVGCALQGGSQELKERTIGVEVFGRSPDYDTNTDHVVRSVAAEVRRRLAQYYVECAQPGELRLELHPGSYVPHFRAANGSGQALSPPALPQEAEEAGEPAVPAKPWRKLRGPRAAVAALAVVAIVVIAAISLRPLFQPSAYERFWAPFLASGEEVMLCFGGGARPEQTYDPNTVLLLDYERLPMRRMHVSDATVLAGLVGVLQGHGKPYRILNRSFLTSFKELQAGPFVLIGALNNQWTMRVTSPLRFGFETTPQGARVLDRQQPSKNDWSVQMATTLREFTRDYGMVARFRDRHTEQMALVVGGLGSWGTLAAGEFVIKEQYLAKLDTIAPRGWEKRNLQIVISTDVIRGSSGPPVIQAAHFW